MKYRYMAISILGLIISIPFILKAINLFNIFNNNYVDGDGIGLYFLGLEINDKLIINQIPQYFWSFLIIGLILAILSLSFFIKSMRIEK